MSQIGSDDEDVGYVDDPLIEEESDSGSDSQSESESESDAGLDTEQRTDSNVMSKKKRKLLELKSRTQEKKQRVKSNESAASGNGALGTVSEQYEVLVESQDGTKIQDSISKEDILTGDGSKALTILDALAFSGIKRVLKGGPLQLEPGSPVALVVCSSATRCTHVIASISKRYHCRVAKLYAKHMKIPDQIESLRSVYPVAVGTPSRIAKLIEMGALGLTLCSTVLLDVSLDAKQFHLLTLPETRMDSYDLLRKHVLPELSHIKIGLIREETQSLRAASGAIPKKPHQRRQPFVKSHRWKGK